MVSPMLFDRQRRKLNTYLKEIIEEKIQNENLLTRVKDHAEYMINVSNDITSFELFPDIFASVNSSLSTYIQILTEINCKLEALLNKETKKWNDIHNIDNLITSANVLDVKQKKINEIKHKQFSSLIPIKQEQDTVTPEITTNSNVTSRKCQIDDGVKPNHDEKGKSDIIHKLPPNVNVESQENENDKISKKSPSTVPTQLDNLKKIDSVNKTCNQPIVRTEKNEVLCMTDKNEIKQKNSSESHNNHDNDNILSKVNLTSDQVYNGHITHVVSPLELYISFGINSTKNAKILEAELQKFAQSFQCYCYTTKEGSTKIEKSAIKNKIGNFALYHSPRFTFHRVKMIDWKLSATTDSVTIQLIDSGEKKNVSINNLHSMPNEFTKYQPMTTECHLAYLPKKAIENVTIMKIIKCFIKSKLIFVKIIKEKPKIQSYPVIIRDKDKKYCLNQLIVDELKGFNKWNPMMNAFKSAKNLYEFDADDPAAAIYGYIGTDHKRICKFYGNTGKCFKKACRKEHVPLDAKGYTTDKEEVFIRALNQLEIPSFGCVKIRVTHVKSPTSFYCIIDKSDRNEVETLFTLQSLINENASQMRKLSVPPGIGQIVIARHTDSMWCRARVVSVLPERDECTVFHVDYGGMENVHLSEIRGIEPRYLHLPFQGILCEMFGIGETNAGFDAACEFLSRNLKDVCSIEIISRLAGEQSSLLVHLFTHDGENVADLLLANKWVAQRENLLLEHSNTYVPG